MPFPDCHEVREFRGYREEAAIVLCLKGHLGSNSISCICLPKCPRAEATRTLCTEAAAALASSP